MMDDWRAEMEHVEMAHDETQDEMERMDARITELEKHLEDAHGCWANRCALHN